MKLDNADVEFYSELGELDKPFDVVMTDEALYAYAETPSERVCARIGNLIDFLAEHPYFGEEYDPLLSGGLSAHWLQGLLLRALRRVLPRGC